jgi:hypothetical protein
MRCQISESRISAFLKSPGRAENCLQKNKTKFLFKFSARNNFFVRVNYTWN